MFFVLKSVVLIDLSSRSLAALVRPAHSARCYGRRARSVRTDQPGCPLMRPPAWLLEPISRRTTSQAPYGTPRLGVRRQLRQQCCPKCPTCQNSATYTRACQLKNAAGGLIVAAGKSVAQSIEQKKVSHATRLRRFCLHASLSLQPLTVRTLFSHEPLHELCQ